MPRHKKCAICGRRHGRGIVELRIRQINRDGGSEGVSFYKPCEIESALRALIHLRAFEINLDEGPLDFAIDAWVVDSESGDADPVEDVHGNLWPWIRRIRQVFVNASNTASSRFPNALPEPGRKRPARRGPPGREDS